MITEDSMSLGESLVVANCKAATGVGIKVQNIPTYTYGIRELIINFRHDSACNTIFAYG